MAEFIKLTKDTENLRENRYPSLVYIKSTGQSVVFYQKQLYSGRLSQGRVTYSSLDVHVDAGNGLLNGISVSWSATDFNFSPYNNTYRLVYVDMSGVVRHTDNFPMTLIKDAIILAFVSVGNSLISRLEEVEKDGYYIFVQKQIWDGVKWVWEESEYRLESGTQPEAFYDDVSQRIYLTFIKNNAVYTRLLNVSDPLSWGFSHSIRIDSNNITLNNDPENNISLTGEASKNASVKIIGANLFPGVDTVGEGFFIENNNPVAYFMPPVITGSYLNTIKSPIMVDIFTKVNGSYILEASFQLLKNYTDVGRWVKWLWTWGTKYIGVSFDTALYMGGFRTDPAYYGVIEMQPLPDKVDLVGMVGNLIDTTKFIGGEASSRGRLTKTYEYESSFSVQNDPIPKTLSGEPSSVGKLTKTYEYESTFSVQEDVNAKKLGGTPAIYAVGKIN